MWSNINIMVVSIGLNRGDFAVYVKYIFWILLLI